jgi:hypothetical protein
MRVLLKASAEEAGASTILVLPPEGETMFETVSGEAERHGTVGEVERSAVGRAISAAVLGRGPRGRSAETLFGAAEWMARALGPYEVGSRIGLHLHGRGCTLDTSQANRIDRAPGLAEGDEITLGPPISETFINARGRVLSIRGDGVQVELDAGDRDRIERSTIRRFSPVTTFPRLCVERVTARGPGA